MSFLSKLKIALLSFGMLLANANVFAHGMTIVYFIPFQIETYAAVTTETIIADAFVKWTLSSESEMRHLIALLSRGSEDVFDESKVRGLILADSEIYFIDSNGVVLKAKEKVGALVERKSNVKIDKIEFDKFRNSFSSDERKIL